MQPRRCTRGAAVPSKLLRHCARAYAHACAHAGGHASGGEARKGRRKRTPSVTVVPRCNARPVLPGRPPLCSPSLSPHSVHSLLRSPAYQARRSWMPRYGNGAYLSSSLSLSLYLDRLTFRDDESEETTISPCLRKCLAGSVNWVRCAARYARREVQVEGGEWGRGRSRPSSFRRS